MSATRQCPALLVAAPASGQGKTTVTAALARLYRRRGKRVRVFKCGPDFLDPMLLERASGAPVHSLDLWLLGEAQCRRLLWDAAGEADLILVEGVMGLYDGHPSAADLAERLGLPVLAVIDASAMAQTFAAVALGLTAFRPALRFVGVIANRVGSARHAQLLREAMPEQLPWLAGLPRDAALTLPSRHLGLVQAAEIADLETRLEAAADALEGQGIDLPPSVAFAASEAPEPPQALAGVRIGVARDAALGFLYAANLELLQALGAQLRFFSPLADTALPEVDSLYLPGGYPELHLETLANNSALREAIRAHHAAGRPILAECGGLLYLLDELADRDGHAAPMLGILPGRARLQPRLAGLGLQQVSLPEGRLRGHSFHHSLLDTPQAPLALGECPNGGPTAEAVYRIGRTTASYIHFYLPSAPLAAAALLRP